LRECLALVMGRGGPKDPGAQLTIVPRQTVIVPDRRNVRILLAEDNPTNQKVARVVLEKFGFRVDVASDGLEAVEALSHIPYDLVLMDCQMPEMDGFEATRLIRGSARCLNPRVPIVAMTANAMRGDRERCIEAGMDDYIAKPVQPRELAELIDRLLSHAPEEGSSGDASSDRSPSGIPVNVEVFREGELLERLMDDRELAREVVAGFLEDLPRQSEKLRDFIDARDAAGARRQAHTIKGAAGNVGAPAIRALAVELEEMGKEGRFEEVLKTLPLLDTEFERLRSELERRGWI
jgi:two-component system, sensor histidine kinase and response regulator